MNRFVSDDFYDDEGGCSDVYNDNPDDWVLERILERRGAEGSWRYLCTWDGYEERTWETRERLASLGYLSRAKAFDAQAIEKVSRSSPGVSTPVTDSVGEKAAQSRRIMLSNVFASLVGSVEDLLHGEASLPRTLPLTDIVAGSARPPILSAAELSALRDSYLRTSDEPLTEETEGLERAVFRFPSWESTNSKAPNNQQRQQVNSVYRMASTPMAETAVARVLAFTKVYHAYVATTLLNSASRKQFGRILTGCRSRADSGLDPESVRAAFAQLKGREARGIPTPEFINAWTTALRGTHELWYPDGSRYRGGVENNLPHAEGVMLLPSDRGIVTGTWWSGAPKDIVVEFPDGVRMSMQTWWYGFSQQHPSTYTVTSPSGMSLEFSAPRMFTLQPPFYPEVVTATAPGFVIRGVDGVAESLNTQPVVEMRSVMRVLAEGRLTTELFSEFFDREFQAKPPVVAYALSHGTLTFRNGMYAGSYVAGTSQRQGQGKYTWDSGVTYDGDWDDNRMHGHGVYRWADGRCYNGAFERDALHGRGCYDFGDGSRFEGEFRHDTIDGPGVFVSDTGQAVAVEWSRVDPLDAIFMPRRLSTKLLRTPPRPRPELRIGGGRGRTHGRRRSLCRRTSRRPRCSATKGSSRTASSAATRRRPGPSSRAAISAFATSAAVQGRSRSARCAASLWRCS